MASFNKEVDLPLFLRGYPTINGQQQQWLLPYSGNKSGPIIGRNSSSVHSSNINIGRINHLVETLEMYPFLAKEQFSIDGGKTKHYPLIFLLSTDGPSLTVIRKVYNMYPAALLPQQEHKQGDDDDDDDSDSSNIEPGYHPLEAAILFRSTSDIISFFILEYTGNEYGVDYDSERFLSLREDTDYLHPIQLMVQNFNGFGSGHQFSKYFMQLYKASPPKTWKHPCIWSVVLRNLLMTTGIPANLVKFLANHETEGSCTIYFGEDDGVVYELKKEPLIQNLQHFIPYLNHSCDHLKFSGGYFKDFSFLDCFFSQIEVRPNFLNIEFAAEYAHFKLEDFKLENLKKWSSCHIRYLTIKLKNIHSDDFKCMVRSFNALPKLQALTLAIENSTGHNCTDAVVELLNHSKSLEWLGLWKAGVEVLINAEELCCALKNSTTSTASVDYDPNDGSTDYYEQSYEIAYLSAMNRHGRAKIAAASSASINLLVEYLVSAEGCNCIMNEEVGLYLEESVLYGLLREAPGLWANPDTPLSQETTKKKKKKKRAACNSLVEAIKTKKMK